MRSQPTQVYTGRNKRLLLAIAAIVLALAAAFVIWRVAFYEAPFVPPAFDPAAQTGVPTPPENMGYGEIRAENGFSFSIVSTMYQQEDGSLVLCLTNPEESESNILCEVKTKEGELLYRSGAIAPGTYVERLTPVTDLENVETPIELFVYAFAPDTWYSLGTIQLANTLYPW